MRFLSTFTGVGGFDLGFERAGMQCIGMCENDDKATAVLNHHWKDTTKHGDIRTAISTRWADMFMGNTDVLIGGAPCQDLSVAGKRVGFDGDRSVLFFDMVQLAKHVKAKYLVYENVPGLLTSNQGRDFAAAIDSLGEAGFSRIEWRTLDSQNFGVPQRRKRIFLVARTTTTSERQVFPVGESSIGDLTSINEAWQETPTNAPSGTGINYYWDGGQTSDCLDVSMLTKGQMLPEKRRMPAVLIPHTFSKKHRASSDTDYESWAEQNTHPTLNVFDVGDTRATSIIVEPEEKPGYKVRRITPVEAERLQGFPDNWTDVPYKGKPASDTQRYKALGNAVTVPVAEYVGQLIIKHYKDLP